MEQPKAGSLASGAAPGDGRTPMEAGPFTFARAAALIGCLFICCAHQPIFGAATSWATALQQMPLGTAVTELNRTNCVSILLNAFRSNDVVKGLIFMPGATDEFYMFRRARAVLTNPSPTLFDAIHAITNQTFIRVTFLPPLLLLHSDEDPLEPQITVENQRLAEKVKQASFVEHANYNDRDWDFIHPILRKTLKADIQPWAQTHESFHFYRHSFAAWNLTGWEALEAVALAGKARIIIRHKPPLTYPRNEILFEPDRRHRVIPKIDPNQRSD